MKRKILFWGEWIILLRIAVCEDNIRELREIMSLIEEYPRKSAYGIEATAFSDSEELAKRIDEFDVFLLDYLMPGIDGLELSKRIRETSSTMHLRFTPIAISSSPLKRKSSIRRSTSST